MEISMEAAKSSGMFEEIILEILKNIDEFGELLLRF